MPLTPMFLQIALPVPMRTTFDYRPPDGSPPEKTPIPGLRVKVNFNRRELVGIILSVSERSAYDSTKVKFCEEIIDTHPCMSPALLDFCQWAASYYHHPVGEVIFSALPKALREGKSIDVRVEKIRHTSEGKGLPENALKRAKKQNQLHRALLKADKQTLDIDECLALEISKSTIRALKEKGLIESFTETVAEPHTQALHINSINPGDTTPELTLLKETPQQLNPEQSTALKSLRYHQFQCYLLEGITGSGKTEVYLHAIARTLQSNRQALILIPEIGLSPQTLSRFERRFNVPIAVLHSAISDGERSKHWQSARSGKARIIIGTRLASLADIKELGIIVIDEEHDLSYKQQDGFRYSARDISIYRARQCNIPIILGSATPSLESLHNALTGKYTHLQLTHRAANATPPIIELQDLRQQTLYGGLSTQAMQALRTTIDAGDQALIFVNRRGYAPTLLCQHCGWSAKCNACDASMTLHSQPTRLHCHHCDRRRSAPKTCPSCQHPQLHIAGPGTEQTEELLSHAFTDVPVIRIDRDTTQRKNSMQEKLTQIDQLDACLLVGTQMLAKGHHLKKLTLVVVVDADQGILSPDFRGPERMGQLITQVAGRAGREQRQGRVILQSYRPDHPILQTLLKQGYLAFAKQLLTLRSQAQLPPFWFTCLFRAESKRAGNSIEFLQLAAKICQKHLPISPQAHYLGPLPSTIERVNNRYRYILQIKCASRAQLHEALRLALVELEQNAITRRTRWALDVDYLEH